MCKELVILENNTTEVIDIQNMLEASQKGAKGNKLIELYLSTLTSKHTVKAYKNSIYAFFKALYGDRELTVDDMIVDPPVAMAYANALLNHVKSGKIKTATYNGKVKGINYFYDWLINLTTFNTTNFKVLNSNPFSGVKQKAENDSEGADPLSPEEIMLMLNNPNVKSKHLQERNRLLLELGISTGSRNDALLKVSLSGIKRIGSDYVLEVIDKFGKKDYKAINNYYERLLEWYHQDLSIRENDNGTIFNMHPDSASRIIREWAKSLNINKKISFHSLRTTTAVQIFHNSGGNLYSVQMQLDHSHTSTSKIYVEKENKIKYDGDNIIMSIKGALDSFEDTLKGMDKDTLIQTLMKLDINIKAQIIRQL